MLWVKLQQKDFLKSISNAHITLSFLFIWNWNDEHINTQPYFLCKLYPIPDQNEQNLYTLWGGTYLAYTRENPPPSRANHSVPWTAYLFKPEMRLIVCLDLAGQVVTGNDSSHAFFKTLTSRMKKIIMSSTVLIWRVNVNTFCVEYYPHFLPDNFADEYKRKVIKGYLFCRYSFI